MLEASDDHWWFRGRARIVRVVLDRLPLPENAVALDAGCGAGRTLDDLAHFGVAHGIDLSPVSVEAARRRGHPAVRQASVESLPFDDGTFDVITCLDVIEHVADDAGALSELHRVARPSAFLIVTVPAYAFLWSAHDDANLHYRRYRRADLRRTALECGWKTTFETSFNSVLLAPITAVRLLRRFARLGSSRSDIELTPAWLNAVLEMPLRLEAELIRRGRTLPVGVSHLMVFSRV